MRNWRKFQPKQILASLVLAALWIAPIATVFHAHSHSHSLCAEHPGEWIEAEAHTHSTPAEAVSIIAIPADVNRAEHEACAWFAALESRARETVFAPLVTYFAQPLLATKPMAAVFAKSFPLYLLAPKNSPPVHA